MVTIKKKCTLCSRRLLIKRASFNETSLIFLTLPGVKKSAILDFMPAIQLVIFYFTSVCAKKNLNKLVTSNAFFSRTMHLSDLTQVYLFVYWVARLISCSETAEGNQQESYYEQI